MSSAAAGCTPAAVWLNAISAAWIAVGAFAQLAPMFAGAAFASASAVSSFSVGWVIVGVGLHIVAHFVVGRLRE